MGWVQLRVRVQGLGTWSSKTCFICSYNARIWNSAVRMGSVCNIPRQWYLNLPCWKNKKKICLSAKSCPSRSELWNQNAGPQGIRLIYTNGTIYTSLEQINPSRSRRRRRKKRSRRTFRHQWRTSTWFLGEHVCTRSTIYKYFPRSLYTCILKSTCCTYSSSTSRCNVFDPTNQRTSLKKVGRVTVNLKWVFAIQVCSRLWLVDLCA